MERIDDAASAAVAVESSNQSAAMGMSMEQLAPNVALVVVALSLVGSLVMTSVHVERAEICH